MSPNRRHRGDDSLVRQGLRGIGTVVVASLATAAVGLLVAAVVAWIF